MSPPHSCEATTGWSQAAAAPLGRARTVSRAEPTWPALLSYMICPILQTFRPWPSGQLERVYARQKAGAYSRNE